MSVEGYGITCTLIGVILGGAPSMLPREPSLFTCFIGGAVAACIVVWLSRYAVKR